MHGVAALPAQAPQNDLSSKTERSEWQAQIGQQALILRGAPYPCLDADAPRLRRMRQSRSGDSISSRRGSSIKEDQLLRAISEPSPCLNLTSPCPWQGPRGKVNFVARGPGDDSGAPQRWPSRTKPIQNPVLTFLLSQGDLGRASSGQPLIGRQVLEAGLAERDDQRLSRDFKREIGDSTAQGRGERAGETRWRRSGSGYRPIFTSRACADRTCGTVSQLSPMAAGGLRGPSSATSPCG